MDNVLVLIADIESSKEVKEGERNKLQQKLQGVLENLSRENVGLLSPYTITLGDEFQAVFAIADHLFADLFKIQAALHPVTVRFSLGIGSIVTPINREQAIGMDGPAFHEAREGIKRLKESGDLFGLRMEGEENLSLKVINNSLQLMSHQMRKWNKRRFFILQMIKEGYDYKFITDELEISEVAFYKNKDAGSLDIIDELSDNIAQFINQELDL
ncbi:MAG: SatD family protein [Balneolaceae bacterium]|jgi:hypothetical protein